MIDNVSSSAADDALAYKVQKDKDQKDEITFPVKKKEDKVAGEIWPHKTEEAKLPRKNDANYGLTPEQQRQVERLKRIDAQVRAHEAAHQAVGGNLVGGGMLTYQIGPDGKQYAVGGDLPVDMSISGIDPATIISKMRQIESAAMAPTDPSGQDLAVALQAAQIESQARVELMQIRSDELKAKTAKSMAMKKSEVASIYAQSNTVSPGWTIPAFSVVA